MNPIVTRAPVVGNERVGAYRVLMIREQAIAAGARPGQFLNIAVETGLLRRPFSIYFADRARDLVAVAFDAIGTGTEWLASLEAGHEVDLVGPLGHGFEVTDDGAALLVGGGYGSAALAFLAEEFAALGVQVHAILGARTATRLFRDEVFEQRCASVHITTDDGSEGTHGLVTDVMPELVRSRNIQNIYACGPNRMLEAVSKSATVRCQLAVEEFMACGIGVCWTCVLPVRVNGDTKHLRSCTEGPVFDGAAVAWA